MAQEQKDVLLEGHEADGIREYDNALPKWWLYGFYFTIVMGLIYIFYYHMWKRVCCRNGKSSEAGWHDGLCQLCAKNRSSIAQNR
jgi:cbb3-type cytochrome c oxidase subunit III